MLIEKCFYEFFEYKINSESEVILEFLKTYTSDAISFDKEIVLSLCALYCITNDFLEFTSNILNDEEMQCKDENGEEMIDLTGSMEDLEYYEDLKENYKEQIEFLLTKNVSLELH